MNLPLTQNAEETFNKTAKSSKKVASTAMPWVLILTIQGETIDVEYTWSASEGEADWRSKEPSTADWKARVWDPTVEKLMNDFSKRPCYVVVEILYTNSEGNDISVPTFFKWCPESGVPVKQKMMIGSCFQSVKRKVDVQGTTPELGLASELDINAFAAAAKLKSWVAM